jgi:hypothetical protein
LSACFSRANGLPEFNWSRVKLVNYSRFRVRNICRTLTVLALGLPPAWADTAQRSNAPTFEQFTTAFLSERDSANATRDFPIRWEQKKPVIVSIQVGKNHAELNMSLALELEDRIAEFAKQVEDSGGPKLKFGGIGLATPENQIVINVGDKKDLEILGLISTKTHPFYATPELLGELRLQRRTQCAVEILSKFNGQIQYVLVSIERGPLSHRCFSEEMLHAMGLTGEFENEVRSVLDAYSTVQYPTELDWALLERLYHPDLSAGQVLTKTVFDSLFD